MLDSSLVRILKVSDGMISETSIDDLITTLLICLISFSSEYIIIWSMKYEAEKAFF